MNLLDREAAHQRAKYLKYKNISKDFTKKKTQKEETVVLDDTSDSNSSSISEDENSPDKDEKISTSYDLESAGNDKSNNSSISSKVNI